MEQINQPIEIGKDFLKKMTFSINQLNEELQSFELENISLESLHTLQLDLFEFIQNYKTEYDSIYQIFSEDYKNNLKTQIMHGLSAELIKKVGTVLLYNKLLTNPGVNPQYIFEIPSVYWNTLQDTLWNANEFIPIFAKIKKHYLQKIDAKIQEEIKKIGFEIAPDIKENYKKTYLKTPMTFQAFIENYQQKPNKNQDVLVKETSTAQLRSQFEKELERKKMEELKSQQAQSFDNYDAYFNLDERELARLKRNPKDKRTISKISRRDKFSKSGGN